MRTLATILIACALTMTFGAQAETQTETPLDADGIGALDEHDEVPRFECIEASTFDQLMAGDLGASNTCSHGIFVRTDDGHGFTHGFSGLPYAAHNWSGVMQSWLLWRGENRGFECVFDEGELVGCEAIGGIFPYVGERFRQECRAYDPYGMELEIAFTEFGCTVFGDVALD